MIGVFQAFTESLSSSSDATALHAAMEKAAAAFDLHRFAYILSPRGSPASVKLISNYPTEWTSLYIASGYDRVDPVIAAVQRSPNPFVWGSGLWQKRLLAQEDQLMEEAAVFGIRCGFTFPIPDGANSFAAVTFAADQCPDKFRRCFDRHREVLQLLAVMFHSEARRTLAPKQSVAGIVLSFREFECLEWAARGKSAWDISQILGISRRTVAFHLDNAKMKLNVRTIAQAVALLAASKRAAP